MKLNKKLVIPLAVVSVIGLALAFVLVSQHTVTMSVNEPLASSQDGQTVDLGVVYPNQVIEKDYLVSNSAPVEEYAVISVTEMSNENGVVYSVDGNETRVVVPANAVDFAIPITYTITADSSVGDLQFSENLTRTA